MKNKFRRTLRIASVIGILVLGAAVDMQAASLPEWLQAASSVNIGNFGQGSTAVVIERREELTVNATGHFVKKERGAVRILNRRAADAYTTARGYENGDRSVTQIKAWTITPGGKVIETGKSDLVTTSDFGDFAQPKRKCSPPRKRNYWRRSRRSMILSLEKSVTLRSRLEWEPSGLIPRQKFTGLGMEIVKTKRRS